MAISKLQDRIRKLKSPLAVDLFAQPEHIPQRYFAEGTSFLDAYENYCKAIIDGMKDSVAAIRLDFGSFALYGANGMDVLAHISRAAHKAGYYILLQIPEPLSRCNAEAEMQLLLCENAPVWFDGMAITAYIGSDAIAPFAEGLKETDKDLFVMARTSNRSAAEMQDLRSGSRLAYMAKADIANRYAGGLVEKCGYSKIALIAAAASADCLRSLRTKYTNMFLWLDGCDYPNANAKNCSAAFDNLGRGAIACAGLSVLAAWQEVDSEDCAEAALKSAERHRRNLLRYITVF